MAEETPPFVLATGSHSAALFRETLASLLQSTGGVVGAGDLLVTQNGTPNMTVNVAAGEVWVPGTSAPPTQGMYFAYNDASVSKAIAAANVTNPRIDRVVATVEDAAYVGSNNDWKLQVITGTPTAGATLSNLNGAGAVPANSLLLANVLVPANATTIVTADIADQRVRCLAGAYPLFKSGSFAHGPHANSAAGSLGAVITFTLSETTTVRFLWRETWSIPVSTAQAYTFTLIVDAVTVDTHVLEMTSGGSLPNVSDVVAVGTATLAAGTHTLQPSITVGGGGPTVTIADTYWELQAVG